mgnify:CR=1 FL=1
MEWNIGNVKIKNQVVLAPMAGVCNSAYRKICKEMGCGLVYAEMVSDKAITFGNKKTLDMLTMTEGERPIVQQIFGSDKQSFVEAAKYIYENMKPDIIDINMGCPVPKVAVRAQAGSALLKNPAKIKEIVEAVVKAVKSNNMYCRQWDVDSLDWKDYGIDSIVQTVTEHEHLGNGSIILLHNGTTYTKDALEPMIQKLLEQGYTFKPVSKLILTENYRIDHEGRQYSVKGE